MQQATTAIALILSDDARDLDALRPILVASGYEVIRRAPLDDAVEKTLRETSATLVLAHVDLKRDTLARPDDVAVIGLLIREPEYAEQHTVVALTRTPEVVETVLGAVLERLDVRVIALPCVFESAYETLAMASGRRRVEASDALMQGPEQTWVI